MLEGTSPFKAASEFLSFQKVASREFEFPSHFPPAARDLIDRLLVSVELPVVTSSAMLERWKVGIAFSGSSSTQLCSFLYVGLGTGQ